MNNDISKTNIITELDVIEITQPIGKFYCATIKAKELLQISYSDRLRMSKGENDRYSYLGIQRELKKDRLKKISAYVKTLDASFPTSILLSINEDCATIKENEGGTKKLILSELPKEILQERIKLGLINPKEVENYSKLGVAKILDGQHRLAGLELAIEEERTKLENPNLFAFENDDTLVNKLENFEFVVAIFIGYDLHEQAMLFANINLQQTKVNKSIVYNLEEYSKSRSPQRLCHEIAKLLTSEKKSPFYERIKMLGCKTQDVDVSEPLTQAAVVEAIIKLLSKDPEKERDLLKRQSLFKTVPKELLYSKEDKNKYVLRELFENQNDGKILDIIWNYFDAVRQKWPIAWENRDNSLLPKNNCFRALMKYLGDIYKEIGKEVPDASDFYEILNKFEIKDEDFESTKQNFPRGDGGMSKFYKYLKGDINYSELKSNNQK